MTVSDTLREALGESLRTVAIADFDEGAYDIRYMRQDISEQYSEDEIESIYQELGITGLGKQFEEQPYEPLGESNGTIEVFDHGINVIRWNENGTKAVFVGLDRDLDDAITAFEHIADLFPGAGALEDGR